MSSTAFELLKPHASATRAFAEWLSRAWTVIFYLDSCFGILYWATLWLWTVVLSWSLLWPSLGEFFFSVGRFSFTSDLD